MGTAAVLAGCKGGNKAESQAAEEYKNQVEPPLGQMTYRENPKTKEKVSLLGYGMMRLPTKVDNDSRQSIVKVSLSNVQASPSAGISGASISLPRSSPTLTATTGSGRRQSRCIITR